MGGYFSETEKGDEVDVLEKSQRKEDDFVYTDEPIFVTSNYNNSVKRMFVTPKHENSSDLENYGILPDLVITKIALFFPLKELPNFFVTSKLFYHCSNSNLYWRERYQSVFERNSNNNSSSSTQQINWKKFFFIRKRKFTNEYFLKKYRKPDNYVHTTSTSLKCCFLGAPGVGKTTFNHRLVRGVWAAHIEPTIGASFLSLRYTRNSDDITVSLELWDTAGQERYRHLSPMFYRGANIIFLCFALNDRKSFSADENSWGGFRMYLKRIKDQCFSEGTRKDQQPLMILLGMKTDLVNNQNNLQKSKKITQEKECDDDDDDDDDEIKERKITDEEVMEYVRQNRDILHGYVELSSKTGENVYAALGIALDLSIKRIKYLGLDQLNGDDDNV